MRTLIVEDDFLSRTMMLKMMSKYGDCDITVNGCEAVEAFRTALDSEERYDLICMDIIMPNVDGFEALKNIREIEKESNISEQNATKIIMTTSLHEGRKVAKAFQLGCDAYAGKPIDRDKFVNTLRKMELIGSNE